MESFAWFNVPHKFHMSHTGDLSGVSQYICNERIVSSFIKYIYNCLLKFCLSLMVYLQFMKLPCSMGVLITLKSAISLNSNVVLSTLKFSIPANEAGTVFNLLSEFFPFSSKIVWDSPRPFKCSIISL